jgi:protein involved in polysaccharide export with SLBB domain
MPHANQGDRHRLLPSQASSRFFSSRRRRSRVPTRAAARGITRPADGTPRTQCRTSASNVFSRPPPRITLGVGDVVSVTIFEAEPDGLLIPSDAGARPGDFVTLPDQVVDTDGNITVPYAGKIQAIGRTAEVQEAINEALRRARR